MTDIELGSTLSVAAAEMNRWEHVIQVWKQAERASLRSGEGLFGVLWDQGYIEQIERLIKNSRLYKGA